MFNWNEAFSKSGMKCEVHSVDEIVTPAFAKELRKKLNVSQRLFAKILGISEKTIEKWEQGANPIKGTSSRLLFLLDKYDGLIDEFYEVKKPYEYYEKHNEYQIKIIPKKIEIETEKIKFVQNNSYTNKEVLQIKTKACESKSL